MIRLLAIVVALSFSVITFVAAQAQSRYAFIVGNNAYVNVDPLQKAVSDAQAVARSLQKLGFDVTLGENLTRRDFVASFATFENKIKPGDIAFLFYSGHGVELDGANYLIPVDTPMVAANQQSILKDDAISTDNLILRLKERGTRTQVVVLDACRENPFREPGGRAIGSRGGLGGMNAPGGVFIIYSAGVGEVALDRLSDTDTNPNSVFTRTFLPLLENPDRSLVRVVKETRARVKQLAATVGHRQSPAYYDEIDGDIFLARGPGAITAPLTPVQPATTPPPVQVTVAPPVQPVRPSPPPPAVDPNTIGFIFSDSDRRYLTRNDLVGLSAVDLRIARNEIYARRGRYFKSEDLVAHFRQFPWYRPFTWDPPLNSIEQANVRTIQSMER